MRATIHSDELSRLAAQVVSTVEQIFDYMLGAHTAGLEREVPLTISEVRALKLIPESGHIAMRGLAGALGVSMPTATHIADRLVKKGIALRCRPEYDRRLVLMELTEEARAHRRGFFQRRVELIGRILQPLSPAARKNVARVMSEIAQATITHDLAWPPPAETGDLNPDDAERRMLCITKKRKRN
jgi:DNA-binding MarR family transcriptional regulator